MKRLILFELLLLILATTFESDSPPGWYQQTLPVNDQINEIYFTDSLNGWVVTNGNFNNNDTSYIMRTSDGGNSWVIQEKNRENLTSVQFTSANTGYAAGGLNGTLFATIYKTTNGGANWNILNNIGSPQIEDIFFVSNDTGWVCDNTTILGGLFRTTNGGTSWDEQLDGNYKPSRLFFLNRDTGWVVCNGVNLYKTTNSGLIWGQIYNFSAVITDVYFTAKDTGWIVGGRASGKNLLKTIDGGFSWDTVNNPFLFGGGQRIFFINPKRGWIGSAPNVIASTKDGYNFGGQSSPSFTSYSVWFVDTLTGWAGGTLLVHTTDGGGTINPVHQISSEVPQEYMLYQNYPNPFNPKTNIRYSIMPNAKGQMSNVKLIIYDVTGKAVTTLVNEEQSAGTYQADWNASGFASGIYFYSLIVEGKVIDTKKMMLIK